MTAAPLTLAPRPAVDHRGFVLVLAGGGYAHRAEHESVDVVAWLSGHGVASGYLDYAIAPERYPTALDQVLTALAELRAGVHGEITGPVAVLGFSAGGHLAGTVLTATDDDVARVQAAAAPGLTVSRPDAAVLCYPVTSLVRTPHVGSRENLLGEHADDADLAGALSTEERVDASTGPAFLWHTADDETVPVSHSLGLAAALGEHGVPYELHVYPTGRHGLGLAPGSGTVEEWTAAALRWLHEQGIGPVKDA